MLTDVVNKEVLISVRS